MINKGMLLIISGPSGSGKGTVVKRLEPEKNYALSISVTTRQKRKGEADGIDYFFKTQAEFEHMRESGGLLEHAVFCGNMYGTPRDYVLGQIAEGKTVVLEIEVNGALQVKERFPDAVLIFLIPPTIEELSRRLRNRHTDSMESIGDRLKRAHEEIKLIDKYDYLVVNDRVEDAVGLIDTIVAAEKAKPARREDTLLRFKGDEQSC